MPGRFIVEPSLGGRIGSAATPSEIATLQQEAAKLGRKVGESDAAVAASAIKEDIPLITRDKSLGNFLNEQGRIVAEPY